MKQTRSSNVLISPLAISAWLLKLGQTQTVIREQNLSCVEVVEPEKIEERLRQIRRDARCVWRAVKLMLFLTALAVVGIGHSTVLMPDWPQTLWQYFMWWPIKAHCILGLASLICAVFFSGLGLRYRNELTRHLAECSRLVNESIDAGDLLPLPIAAPDNVIKHPALVEEDAA